MAIGILVAMDKLPRNLVSNIEFVAELGLMGDVRPVGRVLSAALSCARQRRVLCVAPGDVGEATLARDLRLLVADHLQQLIEDLAAGKGNGTRIERPEGRVDINVPDLVDVRGQAFARRAVEVAAAGGLNLLMVGPPGSGKTMLASRLAGILPPLTDAEAIETARVHSLASEGVDLESWRRRPFRAPHHSASAVALVGGGSRPQPGEVSMAHNGVLFLDELPEFNRHTLDQLREPLESSRVFIARASHRARFPARCQLVAAMNPCPCGWSDDPSGRCRCTPDRIAQYRGRVSGPLLDRIDLQIIVPTVKTELLLTQGHQSESSSVVRERVCATRRFRNERVKHRSTRREAGSLIDDLQPDALKLLRDVVDRFRLSARANHRLIGIARVLADMRASSSVDACDVAEAVSFRCLDRAARTN